MTTLNQLRLKVKVKNGPPDGRLHDANHHQRLASEFLCSFTFVVSSDSPDLELVSTKHYFIRPEAEVKVLAQIRGLRPLDEDGVLWEVGLRFPLTFFHFNGIYRIPYTEVVEVRIRYNVNKREGEPVDRVGFLRRCIQWHELEAIPYYGGLYFDRLIGRTPQVDPKASLANGLYYFPIEMLGLLFRAQKYLMQVGIETVGDLVEKTEAELLSIPGFRPKDLENVTAVLTEHRLNLKGSPALHTPIEELDIGVSIYNAIKPRANTLGDLATWTVADIRRLPGMGKTRTERLVAEAARFGVTITNS